MRDLSQNWPDIPDWTTAELHSDGVIVRSISGLAQHYVSGNLEAYAQADGAIGTGVGALGMVTTERAALRVARDRMLVVNGKSALTIPGWREAGFAVTDVSAALHVFEISGDGLPALLGEATTLSIAGAGPSAAVTFAAQPAVLYHFGSEACIRLHVERGFAAYIWNWLEARA